MDFGKEFRKYAVHHKGMSGLTVDQYMNHANATAGRTMPTGFTPYIIEERPMHAQAIDVFSRLMMDRIIFMGVPVTDQAANIIQAQLLFMESADPNRDIYIYINSPGGSVIAGLGIYDTMQYILPDVNTICTGMAASMGAVLLSAGAAGKRTCLQHSRVMIHQPMGGMQGQVSDMEISYKLIMQMREELYNILSTHSGQSFEKIAKDSDRDYWMRAQEAKEYGIVDEVLTRSKDRETK